MFLVSTMGNSASIFRKRAEAHTYRLLLMLVAGVWFWFFKISASAPRSLKVDETQLAKTPTDTSLHLKSPLSETRPKYQFTIYDVLSQESGLLKSGHINPDVFSVFTFSKQPSIKLLDTAYTILNQSLRIFPWIVFHSCGNKEKGSAILRRVQRFDQRILTIKISAKMDFEGRYSSVISLLKRKETKFFTFLEEGDLLELTVLEKAAWLFSSHPDVSYATTYVQELYTENVVWKKSFHTGLNPFDTGEEGPSFWIMGRTDALLRSNCKLFNENNLSDDTIRKCLQESSDCGVTIPEILRWTQQKKVENNLRINKKIMGRGTSHSKQD